MLYRKYLGIDLGTDNTRIYVKGKGVIVNQPSIVSFNNRTNRIVAVGTRAKEMLAATLAAQHNLYFLIHLVDRIREAILDGRFEDYRTEFLSTYRP